MRVCVRESSNCGAHGLLGALRIAAFETEIADEYVCEGELSPFLCKCSVDLLQSSALFVSFSKKAEFLFIL